MKKEIILIFILLAVLILFTQMKNLQITPESNTSVTIPTFQSSIVKINVPAVDENGKGVSTALVVEAKPGEGRVLTDINHILFFTDTQNSIQIARDVAQNITGVNTSRIDLFYEIETNASVVGGPSAGAALTVATVAALENRTPNSSVMITGTIEPDGSIGPVGAIEEKANASREAGAVLFLVPIGQGIQTTYTPVKRCTQTDSWTYCEIRYVAQETNVSSIGIQVKEVANMEEALKYFLT